MSYEINLVEGERGKLHVTSDDARTENALMFGTGRKVFNMDNAFEASLQSDNTVRVTSGVFYDNGMLIRIDRGQYVEVTVDNGLPGTYRHDLICIRYERNIQTQLESASIILKKGAASEVMALDPSYTVGDVLDLEVHEDEFPLYRVVLNGLTPTLEPMFIAEDVISNIALYDELIGHIQEEDAPGSMHIPAGGANMQILRWAEDGTAVWGDEQHISITKLSDTKSAAAPGIGENFTTVDNIVRDMYGHVTKVNTKTVTLPEYGDATQEADGLLSADDKKKLDGVEAEANKYVHPSSSGSMHIPAGGAAGQILKWTADGTAVWGDEGDPDILVTGIKGNAESSYRKGNVNLTPANIGAASRSVKAPAGKLSEWTYGGLGSSYSYTIQAVAYGRGGYIAVSSDKYIYRSSDGLEEWERVYADGDEKLNDVIFGYYEYIAVGDNAKIYYSDSAGSDWKDISPSGVTGSLQGIVYAQDKELYVTVSDNGSIYYAEYMLSGGELALRWYSGTVTGSLSLNAVIYSASANLFIAVGDRGSIYYSLDGMSWSAASGTGSNNFKDVAYGDGKFVAVGDYCLYYSFDGKNWFEEIPPEDHYSFYGIGYANGLFVMVGTTRYGSNVYYSKDGIHWKASESDDAYVYYDVSAMNGANFLLAGSKGITARASVTQTDVYIESAMRSLYRLLW